MKALKLLTAALFVTLTTTAAFAQTGYTTVTANFAPICYNNGSVQAAWINENPTDPTLPTLNGSTFPMYVPQGIDSDGHLTIVLADNHIVVPNSPNYSKWKITACAKGGSQPACHSEYIEITGTSQDITSNFSTATSACSSSLLEVNGVPLLQQSPASWNDTATVKVNNPASGIIQMTAQAVQSVPAHVGSNCSASTSSGSLTTASVTLNCTGLVAGNTLLLTGYADQSLNAFNSVAMSVSDTQGNTWVQAQHHYGYQFDISGSLWYATGIQAGSDSITITYNASNAAGSIGMLYGSADQFSGINSVYPLLQSADYSTTSGATSIGIFGMTPSQTGDLLYITNLQQGNTAETYSATGYTALTANCPAQGSVHLCNGALYGLSTAASPGMWTPTVNWTSAQSQSGMGFIVDLTAAGASSPVLAAYPPAGIPSATGTPSAPWGTSYTPRGTDSGVPTAGSMSGAAGTLVCKDGNGGIDTTGCAPAGVSSMAASGAIQVNGGTGPATGAVTVTCPGCSSGTDYYFSFTGCTLNVSGNSVNCQGTQNFSGVSPVVPTQPDANYYMNCTTLTTQGWGSSTGINTQTTTDFQYSENVDRYNSISATVTPTVWCHLHHP